MLLVNHQQDNEREMRQDDRTIGVHDRFPQGTNEATSSIRIHPGELQVHTTINSTLLLIAGCTAAVHPAVTVIQNGFS